MLGPLLATEIFREVDWQGLRLRVRRVRMSEVLARGAITSFAGVPLSAVEAEGPDRRAQVLAELAEASRENPQAVAELMASGARLQDARLVLGVVGVSQDGQSWESLTLTDQVRDHAPERNVLWVGALPEELVRLLLAALQELDSAGGATSVASTFRV